MLVIGIDPYPYLKTLGHLNFTMKFTMTLSPKLGRNQTSEQNLGSSAVEFLQHLLHGDERNKNHMEIRSSWAENI
jgi:hypothetical protein